jgi:hypothetical protein
VGEDQATKRVFGGYANESWGSEVQRFGSSSCFLFSMRDKMKLRENPNQTESKPLYLWHNQYSMSFGHTDLVLQEKGDWTSMIENTYSTGKSMNEEEKRTFLAGVESFIPTILEIWILKPLLK